MESASNQDIDEIISKLKGTILAEAVNQVMKTTAGFSMDELRIEDGDEKQHCMSYISGILFMVGPYNMAIMVSIPIDEAYNLVVKISGMEVSQLSESHMFDVVYELANMISGRLKALLVQKGYSYMNSYPFIVYGEDYVIAHRPKLKNIVKRFKAENMDLVLKVLFI